MTELIQRGNCECSVLDKVSSSNTEEEIKARVQVCIKCGEEQKAMLKEFGALFAEFSQSWWD